MAGGGWETKDDAGVGDAILASHFSIEGVLVASSCLFELVWIFAAIETFDGGDFGRLGEREAA